MNTKFALLGCLLLPMVGAQSARAQAPFYTNTTDAGSYLPLGSEIGMPVAFSGTYDVTDFAYRFDLPQDNPGGPTTDATIRFYEPGPAGLGSGDGTLVAAFDEHDLGYGSTDVTQDLASYGDNFQWSAMPLATGETGGWVSIEFSNPDAGWVTATGDSQDNVYQDGNDTAELYDLGGQPTEEFYLQVSGRQMPAATAVPEPGSLALLACALLPGCLFFPVGRRRRH